jgi:hypothetical protein
VTANELAVVVHCDVPPGPHEVGGQVCVVVPPLPLLLPPPPAETQYGVPGAKQQEAVKPLAESTQLESVEPGQLPHEASAHVCVVQVVPLEEPLDAVPLDVPLDPVPLDPVVPPPVPPLEALHSLPPPSATQIGAPAAKQHEAVYPSAPSVHPVIVAPG